MQNNLTREDVEGTRGHCERVEVAAADAVQEGRSLDELVARGREDPSLGDADDGVARASDALKERGDGSRGAELDCEVDVADVDPQLQRRGGDQGLQLSRLQPLLGAEALLAREASVVRGHDVLAKPLRQRPRDALALAARVHEHERRAVLPDERRDAVMHLLAHRLRHDGGQGRRRQLDAQIHAPGVAGVHDDAVGRAARRDRGRADEEAGDLLDRALRRREADAHERRAHELLQARDGEREVRAALARDQRVDLVDDERPDAPEHPPSTFAGEQDVERLGRRHEDVGRTPDGRGALAGGTFFGVDRRPGRTDAREPVRLRPS